MLEAGLFGTFTALNFFHWFLFWELSLIPAFFLIRLWGGPQRATAANQFFLYTMVGSVALLLAFLAIFLCTGKFDFMDLAELARNGQLASAIGKALDWHQVHGGEDRAVLCSGVFLGFAVKVPLVPFHTWLPAAYAEAPTGTTMLLTGTMSKMGVYGFLRILLPIFPVQLRVVRTPLLWLAVATIVLVRLCGPGADGLEAHLRLLFHQSPGLLHAGDIFRPEFTGDRPWRRDRKGCGAEWCVFADVQPWHYGSDAVLVCGSAGEAQRGIARP